MTETLQIKIAPEHDAAPTTTTSDARPTATTPAFPRTSLCNAVAACGVSVDDEP